MVRSHVWVRVWGWIWGWDCRWSLSVGILRWGWWVVIVSLRWGVLVVGLWKVGNMGLVVAGKVWLLSGKYRGVDGFVAWCAASGECCLELLREAQSCLFLEERKVVNFYFGKQLVSSESC